MIAVVNEGADYMLSLRQVQSANVSDVQADPHARSKEWRLTDSFTQNAFRFSIALRQTALMIGFLCVFWGTQVAISQLLGSCVLYLPTHRFFAINTLILLTPALLYFGLGFKSGKQLSTKSHLLLASVSMALIVTISALSLRFNFQPVAVVAPVLAILAVGISAFIKASIEMVPQLPDIKTYNVFNGCFCAGGVLAAITAIFSINAISFALPAALEIAASFIMLGSIVLSKLLPQTGNPEFVEAAQDKPLNATHGAELLPFLVPVFMTALPVLTVLLLALERNWVLFPQLLRTAEIICAGAVVGLLVSLSPVSRRFQLSQHSVPTLTSFGLAFVLAVTPGENQGVNSDISLALLGAIFVYSYVQLFTRAQNSLKQTLLRQATGMSLLCVTTGVTFFTISLQPFLDIISATMLTRFLGLEIVVAGSLTLAAILSWQSRLVASSYIHQISISDNGLSHDFQALSLSSTLPTE